MLPPTAAGLPSRLPSPQRTLEPLTPRAPQEAKPGSVERLTEPDLLGRGSANCLLRARRSLGDTSLAAADPSGAGHGPVAGQRLSATSGPLTGRTGGGHRQLGSGRPRR